MKKPLYTVTVGIPAFNEESNIANLLYSILKQKQTSYKLEEIKVICDGCTDNTEKIVRGIAKNNSLVKIVSNGKRLGKNDRLLELYKSNKSDIVIHFDGDVILANPMTIENLINGFHDENVVYVGANGIPAKGRTLAEKLINTWDHLWYNATKDVRDGNNIFNVHAAFGIALRRSFAKSINLPKDVTSDARMLYFSALKRHKKFCFTHDAYTYYRSPISLKEYIWRLRRSPNQQQKLAKIFGNWIYREYTVVPLKNKIRAVAYMMLRDPIYTILAAFFQFIVYHYPYKANLVNSKGLWKTLPSTKKSISVNF